MKFSNITSIDTILTTSFCNTVTLEGGFAEVTPKVLRVIMDSLHSPRFTDGYNPLLMGEKDSHFIKITPYAFKGANTLKIDVTLRSIVPTFNFKVSKMEVDGEYTLLCPRSKGLRQEYIDMVQRKDGWKT